MGLTRLLPGTSANLLPGVRRECSASDSILLFFVLSENGYYGSFSLFFLLQRALRCRPTFQNFELHLAQRIGSRKKSVGNQRCPHTLHNRLRATGGTYLVIAPILT
jgi:hypothetical protein